MIHNTDNIDKMRTHDHLGNEYSSTKEMCDKWGTNIATYRLRKKRGWDTKDCLLGRKIVHDHLGNSFSTLKEMLAEYSIQYPTYKSRIDSGKTIEQALQRVNRVPKVKKRQPVVDHRGRKFRTIGDMCDYHQVSYFTYKQRLNKGLPLSIALKQTTRHKNIQNKK